MRIFAVSYLRKYSAKRWN